MTGSVRISVASGVHATIFSALHEVFYAGTGTRLWDAKEFAGLLWQQNVMGLLAEKEDQPVGFILCHRSLDSADIVSLGVVPEARREGIAQALIARAEARCARLGVKSWHLEVAADNTGAIALYEKAGFARVGHRRAYYARLDAPKVDALVMCRDIV